MGECSSVPARRGIQGWALYAQATPLARSRSPKRSTGQYLPGLAPATEVRKRANDLRAQHLAKLKRLAVGQRDALSGGAGLVSGQPLTKLMRLAGIIGWFYPGL